MNETVNLSFKNHKVCELCGEGMNNLGFAETAPHYSNNTWPTDKEEEHKCWMKVPLGGYTLTPNLDTPMLFDVLNENNNTICTCNKNNAKKIVGSLNATIILNAIGLQGLDEDAPKEAFKLREHAYFWLAFAN